MTPMINGRVQNGYRSQDKASKVQAFDQYAEVQFQSSKTIDSGRVTKCVP